MIWKVTVGMKAFEDVDMESKGVAGIFLDRGVDVVNDESDAIDDDWVGQAIDDERERETIGNYREREPFWACWLIQCLSQPLMAFFLIIKGLNRVVITNGIDLVINEQQRNQTDDQQHKLVQEVLPVETFLHLPSTEAEKSFF